MMENYMPFSILHMRLVRFLRLKLHHILTYPIIYQSTSNLRPGTNPSIGITSQLVILDPMVLTLLGAADFSVFGWFFVKGVVDSSNL